jgi:hypothetical protein
MRFLLKTHRSRFHSCIFIGILLFAQGCVFSLDKKICKGQAKKIQTRKVIPKAPDGFFLTIPFAAWGRSEVIGNKFERNYIDRPLSLSKQATGIDSLEVVYKTCIENGINTVVLDVFPRNQNGVNIVEKYISCLENFNSKSIHDKMYYNLMIDHMEASPKALKNLINILKTCRKYKKIARYINGKFIIFTYGCSALKPEEWVKIKEECKKAVPDFPVSFILDASNIRLSPFYQTIDKAKLKKYFLVSDGIYSFSHSSSNCFLYDNFVYQQFKALPESDNKIIPVNLSHGYYRDNVNSYRNEFGTSKMRMILEKAMDYNPPFMFLTMWDDYSESSHISPSVKRSYAVVNMIKYFFELYKGNKSFKFNARKGILTYNGQFLAGGKCRFEYVNLPNKKGDHKVRLSLESLEGECVALFEEVKVKGTEYGVWELSVPSLIDYEILIPCIEIEDKQGKKTKSRLYPVRIARNAYKSDLAVFSFCTDRLASPDIKFNFDDKMNCFDIEVESKKGKIKNIAFVQYPDIVYQEFGKKDNLKTFDFNKAGMLYEIRIFGEPFDGPVEILSENGAILKTSVLRNHARSKILSKNKMTRRFVIKKNSHAAYSAGDLLRIWIDGAVRALQFKFPNGKKLRIGIEEMRKEGGRIIRAANNSRNFIAIFALRRITTANKLIDSNLFSAKVMRNKPWFWNLTPDVFFLRIILADDSIAYSKPICLAPRKNKSMSQFFFFDEENGKLEKTLTDSKNILNDIYSFKNIKNHIILPENAVPRIAPGGEGSLGNMIHMGGVPGFRTIGFDEKRVPVIIKNADSAWLRFNAESRLAFKPGAFPCGPRRVIFKIQFNQLSGKTQHIISDRALLGTLGITRNNYLFYERLVKTDKLPFRQKIILKSKNKIKTGRWYTLGYLEEGSKISLLLNGKVEAQVNIPVSAFVNDIMIGGVLIGKGNWSHMSGFSGDVDYIHISNKVEEK